MVEMHHVIVHVLRTDHEIAHQVGVRRHLVSERVFDRPYRSHAVHQRTDTADALRECPGVARVAAAQDDLDAADHGAG